MVNYEISKDDKLASIEYIISCGRDKTIRIWSCQSAAQLMVLIGHDNWVRDMCFHHSGKYLYSSSDDKTLRVWDLTTGKVTSKFSPHDHFVTSVAAHPTYLCVTTCSVDSSVRVWECK